ncbi:MAG: hypothetical protein ACR2IH_10085, partial [Pyrinomonadaceae bacterium]
MSKRISEMGSPFLRWRKDLLRRFSAPFERFGVVPRFWLGFVLLSLLTTLLIYNPLWHANTELPYKEGDVAHESIISPADIYFVDDADTDRLRQGTRNSVRPIFASEPRRSDEAVQNFRAAWERLQRKYGSPTNPRSNSNSKPDEQWTGPGGPELGKVFASRIFSTNELEAVIRVLRENASGDIYGDQDRPYLENEVAIVDRQKPTDSRQAQKPTLSMTPLSQARQKLGTDLHQIPSLSEKEVVAFEAALSPLIQPSVIFDSAATQSAQNSVAETIPPVTVSLKRAQKVAAEGDIITPQMLSQIAAIRNYSSSSRQFNKFFGLLVLIGALYWAAWKYIQHRGIAPRLALSPRKTFALFGFIVIAQTMIVSLAFRLADFTA